MRETQFQHPDPRYRVRPILHVWPQERGRMMDALRACGFGGVVTNVHPGDGFVSNPDNLRSFAALLRELDQAGLDYWIYDEQGYPSGFAGGEALTGHPELEAKGFYMRRKVAYEPGTDVYKRQRLGRRLRSARRDICRFDAGYRLPAQRSSALNDDAASVVRPYSIFLACSVVCRLRYRARRSLPV